MFDKESYHEYLQFMIAQEVCGNDSWNSHRLRVYIDCQSRLRTGEELHREEIDKIDMIFIVQIMPCTSRLKQLTTISPNT
jgi:hypothetical protein